MANAGRRLGPQWTCGSTLAALLIWTQFLRVSSYGGGSAGIACTTARERGKCQPSQPARPDCAGAEGIHCSRNTGDPASHYNPDYTEHPLKGDCQTPPTNSVSPTHTVARDLIVILYPIGQHKKYSLYVSWNTTNTDANTERFFIWSYKCIGLCLFQNTTEVFRDFPFFERGRNECLPIQDTSVRSVFFNGAMHRTELFQCKDGKLYTPPRCDSPATMTVMVVPSPRPPNATFSQLLATSSLAFAWENLDTCWPTLHSAACPSPVFIRPVEDFNLTVTAVPGGGMVVGVTWHCIPGDMEYLVTIADTSLSVVPNCTSPGLNPPCFVAADTTQVTLEGLDVDKEYSISVQVIPKCNGKGFAKHYVGCRSEDCCQAKRIGPIRSGHSSSVSVSVKSSQVNVDSSCVGSESYRIRIESSSTVVTRVHQSSTSPHTPLSAVPSRTVVPTYGNQRDTGGSGGTMGTMIGVGVAVVFVAFFIISATFVIIYFARRRLRVAHSLRSASSLTESLETSLDGVGDEGEGYCRMMTLHHMEDPPTYALTTSNGTCISESTPSPVESSVGVVSQTTIEVGSMEGGSGTASESEKISGVSVSLDDDAFENPAEKCSEGEEDTSKELIGQNGMGVIGGAPKKLLERSRSESVRVKTSRSGSSSSARKRPRSLSTSQVVPHQQSNPSPSALILYSKASPELEQRAIQQYLLSDLTQYNIRTVSEDTSTPRECPASWLEVQMREVSAVFCICNQAFDHEWENRSDGLSGLVPVFKQLCHGLVTPSCGRNQLLRDKIAIVLPCDADLQYVPTYLNSRPKFLLQTQDLVKMARFAAGLPEYQCMTSKC